MPWQKGKHRKGKHRHGVHAKQRRWLVRMLVRKTGSRCEYCNCEVTRQTGDPRTMTIDHVVPRSKGGLDVVEDLRLACSRCNTEKGDGVAVDVYEEGEEA